MFSPQVTVDGASFLSPHLSLGLDTFIYKLLASLSVESSLDRFLRGIPLLFCHKIAALTENLFLLYYVTSSYCCVKYPCLLKSTLLTVPIKM